MTKRFLVASTVTYFFLVGCNDNEYDADYGLIRTQQTIENKAPAENEAPAEDVVKLINKANTIYRIIQGNKSDVDNGQTSGYSD